MKLYRDKQGGTWVYWLDNGEERIYLKASAVPKYFAQGYTLTLITL